MTRKQALELAVQALAENKEAVQVLHTMIDELPLNRWTEAAIRDSVEQFILDTGRPPMRTDFKKKCLPPHTVIKRRFGVTLQEWLDQNYPTEKTPLDKLHAQSTQDFIRESCASGRSAPRITTPAAPIRPGAGTPLPSTTTPVAGASCWKSWTSPYTTTAGRQTAPRS